MPVQKETDTSKSHKLVERPFKGIGEDIRRKVRPRLWHCFVFLASLDCALFSYMPPNQSYPPLHDQAPHYVSDFTDGANLKGLAAIFFLFFACLAPAVAFGGLMGKVTDGHVRAVGCSSVLLRAPTHPAHPPAASSPTHPRMHDRSGPWRCSWPRRTTASPTRSSPASR